MALYDVTHTIGRQAFTIRIDYDKGEFTFDRPVERFSSAQFDVVVQLIRRAQEAYWQEHRIRELAKV